MRKIESDMLQAIINKRDWSSDNTSVHVNQEDNYILIRLHGNLIARIDHESVTLADSGWQSPTTKSRLNVLAQHFGLPTLSQHKGRWYIGNELWIGSKTFRLVSDEPQPTEYDAVLGVGGISEQKPGAYDAVLGGK